MYGRSALFCTFMQAAVGNDDVVTFGFGLLTCCRAAAVNSETAKHKPVILS